MGWLRDYFQDEPEALEFGDPDPLAADEDLALDNISEQKLDYWIRQQESRLSGYERRMEEVDQKFRKHIEEAKKASNPGKVNRLKTKASSLWKEYKRIDLVHRFGTIVYDNLLDIRAGKGITTEIEQMQALGIVGSDEINNLQEEVSRLVNSAESRFETLERDQPSFEVAESLGRDSEVEDLFDTILEGDEDVPSLAELQEEESSEKEFV